MANRVILTFEVAPGSPFAAKAGWSETYWNNQNIAPGELLARLQMTGPATDTVIPLVDRRCLLLARGWMLSQVKVYAATGGRRVTAATVNQPGLSAGTGAGTLPSAEQPDDRLLYSWIGNLRSRSARLGGIPTGLIDPGDNYLPFAALPPPEAAAWNLIFLGFGETFKKMLVNGQFAIRHVEAGAQRTILRVNYDNTDGGNGTPRTPVLVFDVNILADFSAGATVRISGSNSPPGLNGQWTVDASAVNGGIWWVRLKPKRKKVVQGQYTGGSWAVALTASFDPVLNIAAIRGTSKKPGRPSGLPRGRRSNRVV